MTMVYVQNKDGKPLMPTTRYCYVRLLLKEKKHELFVPPRLPSS